MNNTDFLPDGYEVPQKGGNYMRFQDGANRIRILSSPILGWEYWNENEKGERKPIRKRMSENLVMSDIQEPDRVKHFWAMVVWNYEDEKIQILEVTQKGIQRSLRALAKDTDWGSPKNYDIVITRSGKDLETRYETQPKPAKPFDKEIMAKYQSMNINLEALFIGGDPFTSEDVDPDLVTKGLEENGKV